MARASERRDWIPGQNQLHRLRLSDKPSQTLRAGKSRNQAEVDLGLPEARRVRRDPKRTRHGELASAAKRESIDGGNDRLAETLDEIEHVLAAERAQPRGLGRVAGNLVDVGAGDKGLLAGPGHDDAANRVVLLKIESSLSKFVEGRGVERVQARGALNREHRDPGLTLDEQVVKGHRTLRSDA